MKRSVLITAVFLILCFRGQSQNIPYHYTNSRVYEFLEEMSSLKAVQFNNVVLPLTRTQLYNYLTSIDTSAVKLNVRQKKELAFFLQEFVKDSPTYSGLDFLGKGLRSGAVFPLRNRVKRYDLLHYKDKLFNLTVNPVFGGEGFLSGNQAYYQYSVGVSLFGNISPYFSFYTELRDNSDSKILSDESFLAQRMGVNYKRTLDYSEMRGGISANTKWGSLSLVKDHVVWGSNYNGSNILSGRTPSFPMIKLDLNPVEWFSFHYLHAWLISDVTDSTASYSSGGGYREVMRSKYMAANMFTFRPIKGLFISAGNSVIYSDKFNPVYLIPFLFYKSVDHTLNSTNANSNFGGQNSQMFLNLMVRKIKYLQVYFSLFVDEIRLSTISDPDNSRNHLGWKVGTRFTAPGSVNLSLILEYTRTNPLAYRHFVETTTFQSNSYGLGHYLNDNAEEYFAAILFKPLSRLQVRTTFSFVRKGTQYAYTTGSDGKGLSFISTEMFRRYDARLSVSYSIAQDVNVNLGYQYLLETGPQAYSFLPSPNAASPHHLSFGLSFGY
ncbi:MAG: hypothetical protein RL266_451 [Bacteroidota bacterium]